MNSESWPRLGCGAGLRTPHFSSILSDSPKIGWFEAISENFMDSGGKPLYTLEKIGEYYPIALHGTALSIGSTDDLNLEYLARLKRLANRIKPVIISDHLCWSGAQGEHLHDLLPLPFTEETVDYVSSRASQVQDFLGRKILLENISSYVTYCHSEMPEWQFLNEVSRKSGCGILLDLNNVYVNSVNHGFDPFDYLKGIPSESIGQFHLGGHTNMGDFLFDTHSAPVLDKVWDLYRFALRLFGPVPTLIEWDEHIPPFERLMEEVKKAQVIQVIMEKEKLEQVVGAGFKPAPVIVNRTPTHLAPISLTTAQATLRTKISPLAQADLKDVENRHACSLLLNPQGKASGENRLLVYANGYLARMREAMGEVYEACRRVLGEESFSNLCDAYSKTFPSSDYNLNYAGVHFEKFLLTRICHCEERVSSVVTKQSRAEIASPLLEARARNDEVLAPFLADLAALEWAIWKAFHAFHKSPLERKVFESIQPENWENLKFSFQSSVQIVSTSWPVFTIWSERLTEIKAHHTAPLLKTEHLLVSRKEDQVFCERISSEEAFLLGKLFAQKSLGEACEALSENEEAHELAVSEWFTKWMNRGFIVDVL